MMNWSLERDDHRDAGVRRHGMKSSETLFCLSLFVDWSFFFVESPIPLDDCSKAHGNS